MERRGDQPRRFHCSLGKRDWIARWRGGLPIIDGCIGSVGSREPMFSMPWAGSILARVVMHKNAGPLHLFAQLIVHLLGIYACPLLALQIDRISHRFVELG